MGKQIQSLRSSYQALGDAGKIAIFFTIYFGFCLLVWGLFEGYSGFSFRTYILFMTGLLSLLLTILYFLSFVFSRFFTRILVAWFICYLAIFTARDLLAPYILEDITFTGVFSGRFLVSEAIVVGAITFLVILAVLKYEIDKINEKLNLISSKVNELNQLQQHQSHIDSERLQKVEANIETSSV